MEELERDGSGAGGGEGGSQREPRAQRHLTNRPAAHATHAHEDNLPHAFAQSVTTSLTVGQGFCANEG